MNVSKFRIFVRMFLIVTSLFSLVWITRLVADDVYNFYFQKGGAPNSVVQGGGGQTTGPHAEASTTPTPPTTQEPKAAVATSTVVAAQSVEPSNERKPFAITLGYAALRDSISSGRAFTLGLQYNFNRFIGARLQGRMRDLHEDDSRSTANRFSGMLALVVTPLRLDLFGHRLLELSALAGGETSRKMSAYDSEVTLAADPVIGASALLSINENFGIELLASKSPRSDFIGLNVAVLF